MGALGVGRWKESGCVSTQQGVRHIGVAGNMYGLQPFEMLGQQDKDVLQDRVGFVTAGAAVQN